MDEKINIDINLLLMGKGPKEPLPKSSRVEEVLHQAPTIEVITSKNSKKLLQSQISDETCIPIPIISEAVADTDPLNIKEEDIEGFVLVNQAWVKPGHTYICLRIRGNFMHPIISDGFIVAIDLNENDPLRVERHIVAARSKYGITLTYLMLNEKYYVLLPHNKSRFKPIVISKTKPNPIIGKAVWWWGKQK
ncbi:MAG: S24 family peptidase [Candidatus Aminicenantes bacterium]|nr:S24 family peptidase [Candidatus Aminicenantes bacterium]MDH5715786.1 S24 family peptidase [Candidatus Aminicenantes bacterium]